MHTTGMAKIGNISSNAFALVQEKEEQMHTHPTWQGGISESTAEQLLKEQPRLTYLLRQGEKKHSYFISFIQQDGSIKHQIFTLELDNIGWFYRNTVDHGPSTDFKVLIPLVMHCETDECIPLVRAKQKEAN